MKTMRGIKAPRVAGLRQSVEVQQGRQGVGRMLRRGLHGAKNWALELEEDGSHRSAWVKGARFLVLLIPVGLVLSTFTGGTQRQGRDLGLGQALLAAVLSTLVGLAYFSARERRLGREEPWLDLAPLATEGDMPGPEGLVEPPSGGPALAAEFPQVSEVSSEAGFGGGVVTPGDIPGVSDQMSQVDPEAATQVVATPAGAEVVPSPFVQVGGGDRREEPTPWNAWSAGTGSPESGIPGALEEENPTVPLTGGNPHWQPATISLRKGTFPQVSASGEMVSGPVSGAERAATVREECEVPRHSAWPPAGSATEPVQVELFPQVAAMGEVVTPTVMASSGRYPVQDDPVADDWWRTKPDVESETSEAPLEPGVIEVHPDPEPPAQTETEPEVAPEAGEGPEADVLLGYDPAVLAYRAVRGMSDATEEMREEARRNAIQWARRETESGNRSQRSVASALGISKTAVAKWLGREPEPEPEPEHDPWADHEGE